MSIHVWVCTRPHYFYCPSPDFTTSIVSQSVTNNRCAPSCGGTREKWGATSKNFRPALRAGIVPPHLQIASDATGLSEGKGLDQAVGLIFKKKYWLMNISGFQQWRTAMYYGNQFKTDQLYGWLIIIEWSQQPPPLKNTTVRRLDETHFI